MKSRALVILGAYLMTCTAMAQSLYCPQNTRYITPGMTQDEVVAACGEPLTKQTSNLPATQKIPVQELIYTALNTGSVYPGLNAAFYSQWSLPSGSNGIDFKVDVVNGKVTGLTINGSNTNAMSMCGGVNIENGDSVNKVYSACGSPSMVNDSFINQVIPNSTKPEMWIYQLNQYQTPISLTFVNGKLQSIN